MSKEKVCSFDSDACVPFLLSQIRHHGADISTMSTITSPCFETSTPPSTKPHGSSLFSRLSRGLSNENNKHRVNAKRHDGISPAATQKLSDHFDSLSTIKAEESLLNRTDEDKLNGHVLQRSNNRWNGEFSQQRSGTSVGLASFSEKPKTTQTCVSPSKQLQYDHQNFDESTLIFNASPIPVQRSVHIENVDSVSTSESSMQRECASNDEKRVTHFTIETRRLDRSVSWDISPSTGHQQSSPTANASFQIDERDRLKASTVSNSISLKEGISSERIRHQGSNRDEWREVADPESGRVYYYNRRTRVSKWRLPKGAILVKKTSNRSHDQSYFTDQSQFKSQSEISTRRQETGISTASMNAKDGAFDSCNDISQSYEESKLSTPKQTKGGSSQQERKRAPQVYRDDGSLVDANPMVAADEVTQTQTSAEHLKSPQDYTINALFCVYCGLKCGSAGTLGSHLQQCTRFTYMQTHGLSTQIELESALFRAWSQIDSSANASASMHVTDDTGTYPSFEAKCTYNSPEDKKEDLSLAASYEAFNEDNTDPEEVIQKIATPIKASREIDLNLYGVEKKKCPFCEEVFTKGNDFSSHLLKCPARRRARKQRRKKKKENPVNDDPRMKCVTPGRKMPWE